MNPELCAHSVVTSTLLFLLFLPCSNKVHSIGISSKVAAVGFRWFWDPVWMTSSVGSNVPRSRTYLIGRWWRLTQSCHRTDFSVIVSVVHHFDRTWTSIDADYLFIIRFCCLFESRFVSEFASTWRFEFLYFRDANDYVHFSMQIPFLKFVQSSLFALLDGLWQVNVGLPSAPPSSLLFSVTFRISVWWALPFLFGHGWMCMLLQMNILPFVIQRRQSSFLGVVLGTLCAFSCRFSFSRSSPVANLSSSRFLALKWESLSRCRWTINFKLQQSYFSCRQMSSLQRGRAPNISIRPSFQLASCTDFRTCCW